MSVLDIIAIVVLSLTTMVFVALAVWFKAEERRTDWYSVDFDKVQTVKDIKGILRVALKNKVYPTQAVKGMEHLFCKMEKRKRKA